MSDLRVAELVREAQRQAGQVLGQAEPSDAATLSAGWARVLEATVQVLEAMPQPTIGDGPAAGGQHYFTVRLRGRNEIRLQIRFALLGGLA